MPSVLANGLAKISAKIAEIAAVEIARERRNAWDELPPADTDEDVEAIDLRGTPHLHLPTLSSVARQVFEPTSVAQVGSAEVSFRVTLRSRLLNKPTTTRFR